MTRFRTFALAFALLLSTLALSAPAQAAQPVKRPKIGISWVNFFSRGGQTVRVQVQVRNVSTNVADEPVTICFAGQCRKNLARQPRLTSGYVWAADFDTNGLKAGDRVTYQVIAANSRGSATKSFRRRLVCNDCF